MNNGEIWAVAVDLTKMDSVLFEYTHFLSGILRPEKVHFVHVVKEFKHSPFIPNEYVEGIEHQLLVERQLQLENFIKGRFKNSQVNYECHTLSGAPMDEILSFVDAKSVKMVIAGRKNVTGGAGIVSDRLARNLACNFLIVPENFKPKLNTILVSTDFSEHSTLALTRAVEIRKMAPYIRLLAHHSYKVPMGYSKSGKTYDDFAGMMKTNAEIAMNKWLNSNELETVLTLREDDILLNQTMDIVKKNDVDLIIIGSRGQTVASLSLLGSHTLKLLKVNDQIPVLVLKKRGENHGLMEAIKAI
jgi:nucleotide-binding universal stress UspA family protein